MAVTPTPTKLVMVQVPVPVPVPAPALPPVVVHHRTTRAQRLRDAIALLAITACLGFVAAALSSHFGCTPARVEPAPQPIGDQTRPLDAVGRGVAEAGVDVGVQAGRVTDAGARYLARLSPGQSLVWQPYHAVLTDAAGRLRQDQGKLDALHQQVGEVRSQVGDLQAQLVAARKETADVRAAKDGEIAKLKEQADSDLRWWMTAGIVVGGLVLAISVPLWIEADTRAALFLDGLGGGLVGVASTLREHERLIGLGGVCCLGLGLAYLIVKYVFNTNLLAAAESKLSLVVTDFTTLGEKFKQELAAHLPASWLKFFGNGVNDGVADQTLSPVTKALVKQKRASGTIKLANTTTPTPVPPVALPAVAA